MSFTFFLGVATLCWLLAILLFYLFRSKPQKRYAVFLIVLGWASIVVFTVSLWIQLERPPMRTLGETRLWYAVFLPVIGLILYGKWRYTWLLVYTVAMAELFLLINFFNPETYSKTLMPALQSVWFIPHVLVYLVAYAVLAVSSFVAIKSIWLHIKNKQDSKLIYIADNLVYIGFAFLTLGLLFGALWAKQAWGHYWTWDPKEVWAFLTWMGYLIYIHYRYFNPKKSKQASYILAVAFIILLLCWFWVNYSPIAQNSIHTYTRY